ncbi:glycosyltransferase [Gloeocapsopsis crepidinum LEGE 06123]|uniref:Glycosyltransferase n=1 Tax=Gloeocapsopsis crepidinum LEGE 06123 TaxID=588587 RepID=A0ABR9V2I3_9CHRO|nr:glycosyltransferase [Gloeocapsopsis crepidinum]MBE9193718.1 glycosyltransferase [Gloeocapsopsis crepidinum LEGE 06123]
MSTHNGEKYLALCIESIFSQTYSDFNLVVWNDGSLDNSLCIAKKYASFDSRVTVVNQQKQQGFTQSLSQALKMTSSKYLAWVDSDDLILPTCLEETVSFLESNPKYGMVYTQYFDIDDKGDTLGLGHRCKYQYSQDVLLKLFITFHFRLIKRTAFEVIGGIDETYKFAADYDLCLRLSETCDIYNLQKPLYCYRKHQNQISNTFRRQQSYFAQKAINSAIVRRNANQSL